MKHAEFIGRCRGCGAVMCDNLHCLCHKAEADDIEDRDVCEDCLNRYLIAQSIELKETRRADWK